MSISQEEIELMSWCQFVDYIESSTSSGVPPDAIDSVLSGLSFNWQASFLEGKAVNGNAFVRVELPIREIDIGGTRPAKVGRIVFPVKSLADWNTLNVGEPVEIRATLVERGGLFPAFKVFDYGDGFRSIELGFSLGERQ